MDQYKDKFNDLVELEVDKSEVDSNRLKCTLYILEKLLRK